MRRAPAIAVALVLLTLLAAIAYYRSTRVHEIQYVLPPGYHGRFWLYVDPAGARLRPRNGVVTIRIPPNGVARVQSIDAFAQFHVTSASDYSGQKVAATSNEMQPQLPDCAEELCSGSSGAAQWLSCFIGTTAERDAINKSSDIAGLDELLKRLKAPPTTAPD